MAVNGIGPQQVPLSNPFQPGQSNNSQVKQQEERSQQVFKTQQQDAVKTDPTKQNEQRRGSLVDLIV
jgi:hypothetical protein